MLESYLSHYEPRSGDVRPSTPDFNTLSNYRIAIGKSLSVEALVPTTGAVEYFHQLRNSFSEIYSDSSPRTVFIQEALRAADANNLEDQEKYVRDVCSYHLAYDAHAELLDIAQREFRKGSVSTFCYFYDVADGMGHTIGALSLANKVDQDEIDHDITKTMRSYTDMFPVDFDVIQQIQIMKQTETHMRELQKMIRADPSGLQIVEYIPEWLRSNSAAFQNSVPEFMVAGGDLASVVYKRLHQIVRATL